MTIHYEQNPCGGKGNMKMEKMFWDTTSTTATTSATSSFPARASTTTTARNARSGPAM